MRILGMSSFWIRDGKSKMAKDQWTTFRYKRADIDWRAGEVVKVVYKPRRPGGGVPLGIAEILKTEPRWIIVPEESWKLDAIHKKDGDDILIVSERESQLDGFESRQEFVKWFGNRRYLEPVNKLTLKWTQVWLFQGKDPEIDQLWAYQFRDPSKLPDSGLPQINFI